MIKVFLGFVVSFVILFSGAYVSWFIPKAYATSSNVLITQIQAGGIGAATQEFIVLYNNSAQDVDISDWCLTNKSDTVIACFNTPLAGQSLHLTGYGYATAVSTSYADTISGGAPTIAYTPLNQSSGSITGSSDTITLLDQTGAAVDHHSWIVPLGSGMRYQRISGGMPVTYVDTDLAMDWTSSIGGALPDDATWIDTTAYDPCSNIEGVQDLLPAGMEIINGECVPVQILRLDITEILPNAAGSDVGAEFIELYNPNDEVVALSQYQLFVGPEVNSMYEFPAGAFIDPHSYKSFSNADIPFSFLNSSSRVTLKLRTGGVVSEAPLYENPKDNQSWANINGMWQYTDHPTPGFTNVASVETIEDGEVVAGSPQPCATNQYRSLETNRCRLIVTLSTATACKDNQYRSEETNRCRNIATDTKTITQCDENEERNTETNRCRKIVAAAQPAPCKEGQERSPETNRCRIVTKMPAAEYGVLGAETKNDNSWYVWLAVGGVLLLAIAYAVWEWHDELGKFFKKLSLRVIRFARIRK